MKLRTREVTTCVTFVTGSSLGTGNGQVECSWGLCGVMGTISGCVCGGSHFLKLSLQGLNAGVSFVVGQTDS